MREREREREREKKKHWTGRQKQTDNRKHHLISCVFTILNYSQIHHFETVPDSKKLQKTTELWLLKDFKIQIT